jgi:hypothetical protein
MVLFTQNKCKKGGHRHLSAGLQIPSSTALNGKGLEAYVSRLSVSSNSNPTHPVDSSSFFILPQAHFSQPAMPANAF